MVSLFLAFRLIWFGYLFGSVTNLVRHLLRLFSLHRFPLAAALLPLRCLSYLLPSVTTCPPFHPLTLSASLGRLSFGEFT